MTKPFKPLLATAVDLDKLRFPILVSPKLDGIRCIIIDGEAVSRRLKPIPNLYIREKIREAKLPEHFDGELLLRDWTADYNDVQSAVMSREYEPDFTFGVFDMIPGGPEGGPNLPFRDRYKTLEWIVGDKFQDGADWLMRVRQFECADLKELLLLHGAWTAQGFEGSMIRDPHGIYKFGRSTVNQGILLKFKNWFDEEAEVIGVVEQMHNTNEAEKDNLGRTKRSSAKAGMVGKGTMGALTCRMLSDGVEFEVGTGFNDGQREAIWNTQRTTIGEIIKVKSQADPDPTVDGRQEGKAPRIPVFLGFRNVEVD